jgi:hypothetical protein
MCFIQIGAPEQVERSAQLAAGDPGSGLDCGIQVGAPELERIVARSSAQRAGGDPGGGLDCGIQIGAPELEKMITHYRRA